MRPGDYIDAGWREIAALIPTLARGWCGILRGDKLEAFYRGHFGDLTLAQLRTPAYAPIWNVERNRLDFAGPRTHPDLPVARAIRMAVSLPLFVQPAVLDGLSWCDEQFLDTREWPQFMRAGREAMLTSLRQHAPRSAA